MTTTTAKVREHYGAPGFLERLRPALEDLAPDGRALTVAQLAPLDQFHLRGILATSELACASGIEPSTRVLDLGCGIGGPARYLAATFGCRVTGIDLSPPFIQAATYLTECCRLSDRMTFEAGDALHLPFDDGAFDVVFLQHVAMNIEDRPALYAEARRVLAPGGRLATYDLVRSDGEVIYPVPWARDASTSFLLSEADTRAALDQAGFQATLWIDDTVSVLGWFNAVMSGPPPSGPNLGLVMGSDFRTATANIVRNLLENRLRVLSAVLTRD